MGSDISRQVVAQARRGAYGLSSFRTTNAHHQSKYFREQDGKFHVRDDIRAMCSFGQLNLLSTERFNWLVG